MPLVEPIILGFSLFSNCFFFIHGVSFQNKTDDKSGKKTEEVKPKKPVLVKEEITFKQKFLDVGKIGKNAYAASVKK